MIILQKQQGCGIFTKQLTPETKSTFNFKKVGKKIPENF